MAKKGKGGSSPMKRTFEVSLAGTKKEMEDMKAKQKVSLVPLKQRNSNRGLSTKKTLSTSQSFGASGLPRPQTLPAKMNAVLSNSKFDREPTGRLPVSLSETQLNAMKEAQDKARKEQRKAGEDAWKGWVRENGRTELPAAFTKVDPYGSKPIVHRSGCGPSFEDWKAQKDQMLRAAPKERHDQAWLQKQMEDHASDMKKRISKVKERHEAAMLKAEKLKRARHKSRGHKEYNWERNAAIQNSSTGLAFLLESMQRSPFTQHIRKHTNGVRVATSYGYEHPAHHQIKFRLGEKMRKKPQARQLIAFQLKMPGGWEPPKHHSSAAKRLTRREYKIRRRGKKPEEQGQGKQVAPELGKQGNAEDVAKQTTKVETRAGEDRVASSSSSSSSSASSSSSYSDEDDIAT